jgi:hypothetical protein
VIQQTAFKIDIVNRLSFVYKIVAKYNEIEEDSEMNLTIERGHEFKSAMSNFKKFRVEELVSRPFYTRFQNERGAD